MYLREKYRRPENAYPQAAEVTSGYRYYSPPIGGWCSRDPIGEEGGINLYSFVQNGPVNRTDSDGRLSANLVGRVENADSNLPAAGRNNVPDYRLRVQFRDGPAGGVVLQFVRRRLRWIHMLTCKEISSTESYVEWFRLDDDGNSPLGPITSEDGSTGLVDFHWLIVPLACKVEFEVDFVYATGDVALPPAIDEIWFGVIEPGQPWSFTGPLHLWTEKYMFFDEDECCCLEEIPVDYVDVSADALDF